MRFTFVPLFIAALLSGCRTPEDAALVPFNEADVKAFYRAARAPELYGLTPYQTDNGITFSGTHRTHDGHQGELKMIGSKPIAAPIVRVRPASRAEWTALIDTRSPENWISADAAMIAGATPLGTPDYARAARHVLDDIGGMPALASKMRMDQADMENVVFMVQAARGRLGPAARWMTEPTPDSVIGISALRAFQYVSIDFPERTLRVAADRDYQPDEKRLVGVAAMEDAGSLTCAGRFDGIESTFVLDTAGDYEVASTNSFTTVRQISVGDLVFRKVVHTGLVENGLPVSRHPSIGRKLLSRFKVTLDFQQKKVFFEHPLP